MLLCHSSRKTVLSLSAFAMVACELLLLTSWLTSCCYSSNFAFAWSCGYKRLCWLHVWNNQTSQISALSSLYLVDCTSNSIYKKVLYHWQVPGRWLLPMLDQLKLLKFIVLSSEHTRVETDLQQESKQQQHKQQHSCCCSQDLWFWHHSRVPVVAAACRWTVLYLLSLQPLHAMLYLCQGQLHTYRKSPREGWGRLQGWMPAVRGSLGACGIQDWCRCKACCMLALPHVEEQLAHQTRETEHVNTWLGRESAS